MCMASGQNLVLSSGHRGTHIRSRSGLAESDEATGARNKVLGYCFENF